MSVLWIAIPAAVLFVFAAVGFVIGLCRVAADADQAALDAARAERAKREEREAAA